ncbi:hypothetical protein PR048_025530 [Dryococelus australis]|uniref:Uncharacterized protein n=1 Tax=Dryococelus australis TaxID=614101 RepID=A0ABQ9GRP7_9NEOP|nr:hypothetical protein PR048_025530 [Dryococelus australis]
MRVKRDEYGATPNCKAGGNGRSPEKTSRSVASSGTIPTCENAESTHPGIEYGSPIWEASSLTITAPGTSRRAKNVLGQEFAAINTADPAGSAFCDSHLVAKCAMSNGASKTRKVEWRARMCVCVRERERERETTDAAATSEQGRTRESCEVKTIKVTIQWVEETRKYTKEVAVGPREIRAMEKCRRKVDLYEWFHEKQNKKPKNTWGDERRKNVSERMKIIWEEKKRLTSKQIVSRGPQLVSMKQTEVGAAISYNDAKMVEPRENPLAKDNICHVSYVINSGIERRGIQPVSSCKNASILITAQLRSLRTSSENRPRVDTPALETNIGVPRLQSVLGADSDLCSCSFVHARFEPKALELTVQHGNLYTTGRFTGTTAAILVDVLCSTSGTVMFHHICLCPRESNRIWVHSRRQFLARGQSCIIIYVSVPGRATCTALVPRPGAIRMNMLSRQAKCEGDAANFIIMIRDPEISWIQLRTKGKKRISKMVSVGGGLQSRRVLHGDIQDGCHGTAAPRPAFRIDGAGMNRSRSGSLKWGFSGGNRPIVYNEPSYAARNLLESATALAEAPPVTAALAASGDIIDAGGKPVTAIVAHSACTKLAALVVREQPCNTGVYDHFESYTSGPPFQARRYGLQESLIKVKIMLSTPRLSRCQPVWLIAATIHCEVRRACIEKNSEQQCHRIDGAGMNRSRSGSLRLGFSGGNRPVVHNETAYAARNLLQPVAALVAVCGGCKITLKRDRNYSSSSSVADDEVESSAMRVSAWYCLATARGSALLAADDGTWKPLSLAPEGAFWRSA